MAALNLVVTSTGLGFGVLVFSLNKECCFSIDPVSGAVSLVQPLERDGTGGKPVHRYRTVMLMPVKLMVLIVVIVRLTVTAREGGLEAQAKLDVVVKDINDNEPKFEVGKYISNMIFFLLVNVNKLWFQMDEYRVNKMEVDQVKKGEELIKVRASCKILLAISDFLNHHSDFSI